MPAGTPLVGRSPVTCGGLLGAARLAGTPGPVAAHIGSPPLPWLYCSRVRQEPSSRVRMTLAGAPLLLRALLLLALLLSASSARADEATSFFGGRLRIGGEVSGTLAPEDLGFFNYTDYETNTLRMFRIDLAAEARLARWASLLFEGRIDNLAEPRVYALYLRLRPWQARQLDLQAGLVPPVFGAFARRRYALDNPLPSLPLAYQYLTTIREDALPASAEQIVGQRGRGWLVRYPLGNTASGPGRPLVNAERFDAGIELRAGVRPLSLAVALTQGTLSHPEIEDQNGGKQLSARLAWTPSPAVAAGVSGSTGDFVSDAALGALPVPQPGPWRQQALGLDLEWSAGRVIVRGEAVFSRWRLPAVEATLIEDPLGSLGMFLEARFKLAPGVYLASRVERLDMSGLQTVLGPREWDARVARFELGGGWSPARRVLLKASWQHNSRDGGRVRRSNLVAGQVLLWF